MSWDVFVYLTADSPLINLSVFHVDGDAQEGSSPAMRSFSDEASKYCCEVRLRLKSDAERDVDEALFWIPKKRLRAFYAPPQ